MRRAFYHCSIKREAQAGEDVAFAGRVKVSETGAPAVRLAERAGAAQRVMRAVKPRRRVFAVGEGPEAVAGFFASDGQIVINRGIPLTGHGEIADMARRLKSDLPDLDFRCDMMRKAGDHALFVWTLEGHHANTGNPVTLRGWEEWELGTEFKVRSSSVWFDAEDFQRQVNGA